MSPNHSQSNLSAGGRISAVLAAACWTLAGGVALADSVAQVQTAKRIAETTVALIDPQGGTSMGGAGSNVNYAVGDILTFTIRFTPVENGATRGLGGYITEYVPPNTEVVGARIVDAAGNTICPHRGGYGAVGWGPRNAENYDPMDFPACPAMCDPVTGASCGGCCPATGCEGGMSSLYADVGIFFSTDPRTERILDNDFITVFNGLPMSCNPTGAGQLDGLLGATGGYFAHNEWDNIQLQAFGCGSSFNGGTGNTPFGYGSAVAGPDTFYSYEATETSPGVVELTGTVGPWERVLTPCAEVGTGIIATEEGPVADRLGVPTSAGWVLSPDNPLPPGTNAVRFAVGELVVGEEYLAEISLRVLAAPLDPIMGADVNCSEVFGGDASARSADGGDGGKDNTWRYFLPAPACVSLDLLFDLDVDKIVAQNGDTLTYTITAHNLDSVNTHTNVVITDDLEFGTGGANFVSATGGGIEAGGVVTWPAITLMPGDSVTHTVVVTAGGGSPILNRATFTSDQLPLPGFSVVSLTNVGDLAIQVLTLDVAPVTTTAGGTVTYTATVTNTGSGDADWGCADCAIFITLPPDLSVVPGTTTIDGAPSTGEPDTTMAPLYVFDQGMTGLPTNLAAGATMVLTFDALVDPMTAPGVYTADLESYMDDPANREIDDAIFGVAPLYVDVVQSDIPTITTSLLEGGTMVCGLSTEPDGTVIHVYVGLLEVAMTTVMGGMWCTTVPGLIAGEDVYATAENTLAGEVESDPSPIIEVTGTGGLTPACSDGMDNDGDGLTDFPADPGCVDANDLDETDVPECSDGIDNDGDMLIDFPNDPGCSAFTDPVEDATAACSDGVDNDGDGQIDFPADPGCTDANDVSEADLPECSDGIDNDGDGQIDFPADPECSSAGDGSEMFAGGTDSGVMGTDSGAGTDSGVTGTDAGGATDAAMGTDSGMMDDPGRCGCRVVGVDAGDGDGGVWLLLGFAMLVGRRRRRRAR